MAAVVKKKQPSEAIQDEALQVVEEEDEKLLAGAPALIPYRALRVGRRKVFVRLMKKFQERAASDNPAPSSDEDIPLDEVEGLYDLLDEMDRALETVAIDPEKYVAWVSDGATEEKVAALFRTYVTDLGNSISSAN